MLGFQGDDLGTRLLPCWLHAICIALLYRAVLSSNALRNICCAVGCTALLLLYVMPLCRTFLRAIIAMTYFFAYLTVVVYVARKHKSLGMLAGCILTAPSQLRGFSPHSRSHYDSISICCVACIPAEAGSPPAVPSSPLRAGGAFSGDTRTTMRRASTSRHPRDASPRYHATTRDAIEVSDNHGRCGQTNTAAYRCW